MSYATNLPAISRRLVDCIVLTLDYCSNTFGSAPCTATGTKCYNTFGTCRDKTNFTKTTKDYTFTSANVPAPFRTGERPYIKSVDTMPTEIKDNLTVNARVKVKLCDEPDTDVGIDPYVATRTSVQGTFWKKLLARNHNYKGRPAVYRQGFYGDSFTDDNYPEKFVGVIDNITIDTDGGVTVEIVDLLKNLDNIYIPPKLSVNLAVAVNSTATEWTLSDTSGLDASGYVRCGDEIIYYTTKNDTTNIISVITRGVFSTTAEAHSLNAKVQKCRYYTPDDPFDILETMLSTDAGIAAGYIDSTAFAAAKAFPAQEINYSAIISEPTKLSKLYFELIELLDCRSWAAEDLKVTIKRVLPNQPGRSYSTLTDSSNIINKSDAVDLNTKSIITRCALYWDLSAIGKLDEPKDFSRLDIGLDADAEGANEYNQVIDNTLYCRWIRAGLDTEERLSGYAQALVLRRVRSYADPQPIISLSVELKDSAFFTGTWVDLATSTLQDKDGNSIAETYQIVKREAKGAKIAISLRKVGRKRIACFAASAATAYSSATAAEKEYGYWTDSHGEMTNGDDGYYFY